MDRQFDPPIDETVTVSCTLIMFLIPSRGLYAIIFPIRVVTLQHIRLPELGCLASFWRGLSTTPFSVGKVENLVDLGLKYFFLLATSFLAEFNPDIISDL